MVIFIDETTVELQNDLPEFDAFPIKLGTWILCFSCVFQIEILHIKTCIQQKWPIIFHKHSPKFLDYQWTIQVSSPWVGFAGHKRASLQLRKTYGTWVLGLAYPWISTGSGDVISIWGALKGEKVLIRRGLEVFFFWWLETRLVWKHSPSFWWLTIRPFFAGKKSHIPCWSYHFSIRQTVSYLLFHLFLS